MHISQGSQVLIWRRKKIILKKFTGANFSNLVSYLLYAYEKKSTEKLLAKSILWAKLDMRILQRLALNINDYAQDLALGSESDQTGFKKSSSISPALVGLKRKQQNEKISDYNYFGAKEKKSLTTRGFQFVSCVNVMYIVSFLVVRIPT